MQYALMCGVVAALSFIGFVSIVYYILLFVYRPKGQSRYIIRLGADSEKCEAERLIYGAYIKKLVFGDLIFDEAEIQTDGLSDKDIELIKHLSNELGGFIKIHNEDSIAENGENGRQPD